MSNRALPIVEQEDLHDVLGQGQNGRLGDDVVQGNIGCLRCFSGEQPCDGGEQELSPDLLLYAERGLGVELALSEVVALEQLEELLDDPSQVVEEDRPCSGGFSRTGG